MYGRITVQNLPSSWTNSSTEESIALRIKHDVSISLLKDVIRDSLQRQFQVERLPDFSIEVYNPRQDRYTQLDSDTQLKRRNLFNVILCKEERQDEWLALPSRIFPVDPTKGEFLINDQVVFIGGIENAGLGTGLTTWDGSIVLAKYLEYHPANVIGKRIVEVGAGTGLVGIAAALLGATEVILTDLEYTMDNLSRNIATVQANNNSQAILRAEVLDWFHPQASFGDVDIILASDVVWVESLIPALVHTLDVLVQYSRRPTRIFMSHQLRSRVSDAVLFNELDSHGFSRSVIPINELHPQFKSERISIWEITK